jgi:hypothetical protein
MAHPAATKRTLPLGDALAPTIDRLRDIATASYDTLLLAEGPPQPDFVLLDLCSETLHAIKKANAVKAARLPLESCNHGPKTRDEWQAAIDAWQDADREATRLLRRVSKIPATTAAGLYAKALVCRSSASGAAVLSHSLADDFIACEGLRASLWPADSGGAGAA